MAKIPGFVGESGFLNTFDYSGSIATGGTPQLIVPRVLSRSYFCFENTSDTDMRITYGPATVVPTITSGVLASVAVTNAGFGYTKKPLVRILGGGTWNPAIPSGIAAGLGAQAPTSQAAATAVLSSDTIGSITVDVPGSGYSNTAVQRPYVWLEWDPQDPYGCKAPSATVGFLIRPGGSMTWESSIICTEPFAVYGATTGKTFECKVMQ